MYQTENLMVSAAIKLLAAVLLFLGVCVGQTHTEMTLEDVQTATGNKTFSGTTTFSGPVVSSNTAAFSGAVTSTGTVFETNPGVFTNTQMNEYIKSSVNGCNTATEQAAQSFNSANATNALSVCLAGPSTGGASNSTTGIGAYVTTNESGGAGGATAINAYCRAVANDSTCIGIGVASYDQLSSNTQMELVGVATGVKAPNPGTAYQFINGYIATGLFTGTGPYLTSTAYQTFGAWQNGFQTTDGGGNVSLNAGTTSAASGASQSAPIRLNARNSGTTDSQFDIIAFAAAPSGTCANNTLAVRVDNGATVSTLLYVCLAGTSTWTAITIP